MRINANFSERAISAENSDQWVHSPEFGVDRRMLDRIGSEVARATSIVRYAPRSSFPRHTHAKGEEFLVLEGIFSDENGSYPRGTYVRNPPGSGHSPFSTDGCRILVKLRQFDDEDLQTVVIDTTDKHGWEPDDRTGGDKKFLHGFAAEQVSMLRFNAARDISIQIEDGGLEWLLVSGSLRIGSTDYTTESWFRFPAGDRIKLRSIENCVVWQKTGHLPPD